MRSRNIKPGFFKNELLADMPTETRLLFIGLWLLADREGRLEDRPKRIKAELFAYDQFDVDSMLNRLQADGFLFRYEIGGELFIEIDNFVKHQDPHYREKSSSIPPRQGLQNKLVAVGVTRTQRARILERDSYSCQECGSAQHLCIDHILPISRGGTSGDDNLQTLCLPCNTRKGNKLSGENYNKFKPNLSGRKTKFNTKDEDRLDVEPNDSLDVPLIPDSLIPDSLIPDSLIPKDTLSSSKPLNGKIPPCPHQEIIELYHEILPELPRILEWTKPRQQALGARWREKKERQTLEWWRSFFLDIRKSDFLMGKVNTFRADLEWVTRPKNFPKVIEGKYGPRRPGQAVEDYSFLDHLDEEESPKCQH